MITSARFIRRLPSVFSRRHLVPLGVIRPFSEQATSSRVKGNVQSKTFQAETKLLLDIVANSLYTDKDVFIRELVSNASDALEKWRLLSLTESSDSSNRHLEIMISTDEAAGTLTIVDNGVGMTYDELVENLGTIARSGSKAFIDNVKTPTDASSIIGKFGVGFYSAFMVADKVEVFTRSSMQPDAPAYYWASTGTGSYDIAEAEGVPTGTRVVLHLKKDSKRFSKEDEIRRILSKHSSCLGFPLSVNGKAQSSIGAIWLRNKKDVTDDEYADFYKQTAMAYDKPFDVLHFSTDVPLALNALLYLPKRHTEKFGMGKEKPGVHLYSRKVMIQPNSAHLLPDWLRFVKGVVDSADIPLNISRESMQNSALIRRIANVLTQRVLRHLAEMAKHEPARYAEFFEEFGQFLKEGICVDEMNRARIAPLLRFASSQSDTMVSLDEYVARMPSNQSEIYYFCSPSRELALSSPYFEAFKERNFEVLFLYREVDDFVMQNLRKHADRPLVSIESAKNVDGTAAGTDANPDAPADPELESIRDVMPGFLESVLGDKVTSVSISKRLVSSPAILIDHENAAVRRMMRMVEGGKAMVNSLSKQKMEINVSHPIIRGIYSLRESDPALAKTLSEQVFDNAMIAAGLMDDPRSMLSRINQLMERCVISGPAPSMTVSEEEAELVSPPK